MKRKTLAALAAAVLALSFVVTMAMAASTSIDNVGGLEGHTIVDATQTNPGPNQAQSIMLTLEDGSRVQIRAAVGGPYQGTLRVVQVSP